MQQAGTSVVERGLEGDPILPMRHGRVPCLSDVAESCASCDPFGVALTQLLLRAQLHVHGAASRDVGHREWVDSGRGLQSEGGQPQGTEDARGRQRTQEDDTGGMETVFAEGDRASAFSTAPSASTAAPSASTASPAVASAAASAGERMRKLRAKVKEKPDIAA